IDGGDGKDRVRGGAGADLITGGLGDDWLSGYGADDTLLGGEGDDSFGWFGSGCSGGVAGSLAGCTSANAGADRLDGGPGDDRTIVGWEGADGGSPDEYGPDRQEKDAIICGPGSDGVLNGLTDEVGIDCEELLAFSSLGCQAGGVCRGEITVEASVPGGGSASASAKRGGKGRKVTLARKKFRLSGYRGGGLAGATPLKLNGKAVRRVLRGRKRASAQIVVRVEKRKGKKSAVRLRAAKKRKLKTTSRTRFRFTKG
ncbi:MAG: calcium-binding protein, partial [Solirubrobacterales bacterium]